MGLGDLIRKHWRKAVATVAMLGCVYISGCKTTYVGEVVAETRTEARVRKAEFGSEHYIPGDYGFTVRTEDGKEHAIPVYGSAADKTAIDTLVEPGKWCKVDIYESPEGYHWRPLGVHDSSDVVGVPAPKK